MYARVESGKVVRLYLAPPAGGTSLPVYRTVPTVNSDEGYVREKPFQEWTVLPDRVEVTFQHTEYDLETERRRKLDSLRSQRKAHKEGGFDVDIGAGPVRVKSTESAQSNITGAKVYTDENPDAVIDWEIQNGQWVQINATQVRALASAIGAHVQATFTHAKALEDQINAVTTLPELWAIRETDGWPGS